MSSEIAPIELPCQGSGGTSLWRGQVMPKTRWTMADILQLVSDAYGLSVEDMKGHCRTRRLAWPRQHAMWLMSKQPHLSLPQIGRFLDGRDHTTILHGVRRHQARSEAQAMLEAA